MPHYQRGKIRFEHHKVGTVDSTEDVVEKFSCHPKPRGRRTGHNPTLEYAVHQPASFVQPDERTRIETYAAKAGETLSFATVIAELKSEFKLEPLKVDLARIPQQWRKSENCLDVTIAFFVRSVLLRIDAVASEDITHNGVTWPAGDTLAQFRFVVPDQYQFLRHKERNIQCCPLADGEQMPQYDPETAPMSLSSFVDFSYLETEGWNLGVEYNWNKWKLGLKANYEYYDPPGEEEPRQPWILPLPKPGF